MRDILTKGFDIFVKSNVVTRLTLFSYDALKLFSEIVH